MNTKSNPSSFEDVLRARRSVREFDSRPLTGSIVQRLVWAAQGKTDSAGNRTSPSAHGLHPLRVFVSIGEVEGMASGFYAAEHESGELQQIHDRDLRPDLANAALEDQPWVSAAPCVLSMCADFISPVIAFADQPPLGQRGLRYIQIEAGASAQSALLQATSMGVGGVLVAGFDDDVTAKVLQLQAPFAPVLHLCFGWPSN